jgi:hypothetical protein
MSELILKILHGSSGSKVELIHKNDNLIIRKTYNIERNLERIERLTNLGLSLPNIISVDGISYDMSYVPHDDTATWLANNNPLELIEYIKSTIDILSQNSKLKNYKPTYINKLKLMSPAILNLLPFKINELIDNLPESLPSSEYHGDFTLENIIFNKDENNFYLIDPLTSEYDSWIFDLAKLCQDLKCKWFIRHRDNSYLDSKLASIYVSLKEYYSDFGNPYLIILMLLRIIPYVYNDIVTRDWLIKEITQLYLLRETPRVL